MFTATKTATTTTTSICRLFSTSTKTLSNVGKKPIRLYEGVNYSIESIPVEFCKKFTKRNKTFILDRQIITSGPLGKLRVEIPEFINISENNTNENDKSIIVSVKNPKIRFNDHYGVHIDQFYIIISLVSLKVIYQLLNLLVLVIEPF